LERMGYRAPSVGRGGTPSWVPPRRVFLEATGIEPVSENPSPGGATSVSRESVSRSRPCPPGGRTARQPRYELHPRRQGHSSRPSPHDDAPSRTAGRETRGTHSLKRLRKLVDCQLFVFSTLLTWLGGPRLAPPGSRSPSRPLRPRVTVF